MTKWGSRNPLDYKAKLKLNNIISDRSFISEMIYTTAFDMMPRITLKNLNEFMELAEKQDWKFIILTAPIDDIKNRLINRGNEDQAIIENIDYINELYQIYSRLLHIPTVDTSKADYLNEIVKEIENDSE